MSPSDPKPDPIDPPTTDLAHPPAPHRLASILSWAKGDDAGIEAPLLDLDDPEQADFGAYQLLELIGQGGMGLVYRARQKSLERDVALKLLGPAIEGLAGSRERFRREARLAAALNHPNILPVLEVGMHGDVDYIAMPLARGETLAARCQSGPMPADDAVALMLPVCEAIDYAHRLGLLHLDLKPANILFDEHGAPLVADFGLARPMDASGQVQAQEVSGTPGFMAPEQVLIREFRLSRATDGYALGAILFRLLTGRSPHGTGDVRDVLQRALAGRIEPMPMDRSVPRDLQAICSKAMAWRPEDRYGSVGDLVSDLRAFRAGLEISVRRPALPERLGRLYRRDRRLAWVGMALFAACLALALMFGWLWRQGEQFRQSNELALWFVLSANFTRPDRPDVWFPPDESVPITPCRASGACPDSSLQKILDVEDAVGRDAADALVAMLADSAGDPDIDADARDSRKQVLAEIRHRRANRFEESHALALAEEGDFPGVMAAAALRAGYGYQGIVDGYDRFAALSPSEQPTRGAETPARMLYARALSLRSSEWTYFAAAAFCNVDHATCRDSRDAYRKVAPDNAAAILMTLPEDLVAAGLPGSFPEAFDAAVIDASHAPRFQQVHADALPAIQATAAHVRDRLDPADPIEAAFIARETWRLLGFDLLHRLGTYCRFSAHHRDRPDIDAACARLFTRATESDPLFLRHQRDARCLLLHHLPFGETRDRVREEFRQLSWLSNAAQFLPYARDDHTVWATEIRAGGSIGYLKARLSKAGLPTEAPAAFITVDPMPWRTAEGQVITYPAGAGDTISAFSSGCNTF